MIAGHRSRADGDRLVGVCGLERQEPELVGSVGCELQVELRLQVRCVSVLASARDDLFGTISVPDLDVVDRGASWVVVEVKIYLRDVLRNLPGFLPIEGAEQPAARAVVRERRLPVTEQGHIGCHVAQPNSFVWRRPNQMLGRVTASFDGSNEPAQDASQNPISSIELVYCTMVLMF